MPVFWFSANATGPENPEMQALIAKYPVAILAWQMGTNEAPVFRHGEDKLHAQAAALAVSAPSTEVLIYIQGQLAIDWYESTRAMLPPPCGGDATGKTARHFPLLQSFHHNKLISKHTHTHTHTHTHAHQAYVALWRRSVRRLLAEGQRWQACGVAQPALLARSKL